jgi:L-alanine-DL-glutamate epimerase-like enolase superfamily enzyme
VTQIERLTAAAYEIPTEQPESDGTLQWDSTVLVIVRADGGGMSGLGYTYGSAGCVDVVAGQLGSAVRGLDATRPAAAWAAMLPAVRNVGWPGVAAHAISAVDIALWDLAARLRDLPLVAVLGAVHDEVPIYGSGGFCNYDDRQLAEQLSGWVAAGIPRVKMKVGRDPEVDRRRLAAARQAIGPETELFVDANGAFDVRAAVHWAQVYAEHDVRWFEEPVSSDDLDGLAEVRRRAPGRMEVTAGEYGYRPMYFERMLANRAVDCLQADVTRCGGITGFHAVGALCEANGVDLSAHCAPGVSAHACTAVRRLRHLEYFHDHVRIEAMLFDGTLSPEPGGLLRPDPSRPGHGLELKEQEAARWRTR